MKYCPDCKKIIPDGDVCDSCGAASVSVAPESEVTVATVKGSAVAILETALKEAGIPCCFIPAENNVYNAYNAKVSAESNNRVTVPYEMYNRAFDVCLGFGFVEESDRLIPATEEDTVPQKTYDERFEESNGMKRRTWQTVWMVIFIVAACLLIWGIDWIAEFIKMIW